MGRVQSATIRSDASGYRAEVICDTSSDLRPLINDMSFYGWERQSSTPQQGGRLLMVFVPESANWTDKEADQQIFRIRAALRTHDAPYTSLQRDRA
jgi:hypothetical protein